MLAPSPARLEHAYALYDLGCALAGSHAREAARPLLRQALELADDLGAALLAGEARRELVAAGARPRRRSLSGVDALTPSERRVAGMAAEGRSNREIAQVLYVTPRTVEMHVSAALRKLRVRSRTQLAEVLPVG